MRPRSRKWRWLGVLAILGVGGFLVVRSWVVPAILVQQIQAKYRGKVVLGNWWFHWNSSGVDGIELHETASDDSPAWFSAEKISTDVGLSRLLHGEFLPSRVEIDRPKVDFKLDAKGQPTTKIPIGDPDPKAKPEPIILPEIVTKGGEITIAQEGRKPMTIRGVDAKLSPAKEGSDIAVTTDDPTWGQVALKGHLGPNFKEGVFEITSSPGFVADPQKLEAIPFIPAEVWANIEPRGPVDAKVRITLAADSPKPVSVHTELTLKGTAAKLNSLQVEATDTTGRVVIDDTLVRVDDLKGKTLDGTIAASGQLDFGNKVPRFDLDVRLKDIDVTKAPKSWQLGEVGATGRLSGRVDLRVALDPKGPDLTGTAGRAVIEGGSFQGIPIKSIDLGLRADGNDLQYETLPEGTVDKNHLEAPTAPSAVAGNAPGPRPDLGSVELPDPVLAALPILDLASRGQGLIGWVSYAVKEAVAFQVKQAAAQQKGGIRLPKTITTKIELEDVELQTIVDKARKFGIELGVPISGKFSINAIATIPLGALRDIQAYAFQGDFSLKGASIDHVDLGTVLAHLELLNGVLDLTDFRGLLVDKPAGTASSPPGPSSVPPVAGPLPVRGFRGNVHAMIAPRGPASARFEGNNLPLGELFAPLLPNPTPLSGEATLVIDAKADLARIADPKTWSFRGHVDSRRIKYLDAVLDQVAAKVVVQEGRVELPEFAARLQGRPLNASGQLEIAAPHRYDGRVTVEGWEVAEVLKFVPGVPSPPPASGTLDAKGEASGTLQPFAVATKGGARVLGARVGPAPVGNLGFRWVTDADSIAITGLELMAFGGKTTGEARIPTMPGKPIHASAEFERIDAGRLAAAFLGKDPVLAGRVKGRVELTMPLDASEVDGHASLRSTELTIREGSGSKVAVKSILVDAVARKGVIDYEATAEGLGGRVRFHGSAPVVGDRSKAVAEGELLAVRFRLGEVFKALGLSGGAANLDGLGAFDANIRAPLRPFQLAGRGQFEMRELRYGSLPAFGNLKGVASLSTNAWRLDGIEGDLMGGLATGEARGETLPGGTKQIGFDFRLDRASLPRLARLVPGITRGEVDGFATLRVAGTMNEAVHANAEVLVARGKVQGIPVTDLRLPVEFEMNPASGDGSLHSRHWTARVAGGSVRGNAYNRFGHDHAFQTELNLAGVDLEILSRFHPAGKKPPTGKVSGKITLQGPNAEHVDKIRGRVDLDLDDASVLEVPMFRELDKFLGSSGGGLFDDGDIHGVIANKTIYIEQMTMTGKLVQVHATGSVSMNGGLNLEILVNTNSQLSQPELALLNVVPGLGRALGEGEEAIRRVVGVLESSLLKFRVTGTTNNPHVQLDPGVAIGSAAVGFFTSVVKLPGR